MKIIDIREATRPIASNIRNAYIDFSKMTLSLVAVVTDVIRDGKPVIGYGFNSNGRYGQGAIIRDRLRPRIMDADPKTLLDSTGENLDPAKIWACMMSNEKPGGHGERSVAVGTIDMAVWDAVAKIAQEPLFDLLSQRYGNQKPNRKIFVYAAGGYYYPGKNLDALKAEMKSYTDRGYTVVKMKIGGAKIADDLARIEAVLSILPKGHRLAVDANGKFDLPTAIDYAKALLPFNLFWYEEAGDPLDYQLQAELGPHYPLPMATGENLFSMQDARNLIRYAKMRPDRDWLQFDCALSYGLVEYLRTLDMLKQNGWSPSRCIPHGGHQMSLNIAAGLGLGGNESYPDLFQPYGGFPDGVRVEEGHITMPDLVGIGFEGKSDLYHEMRIKRMIRQLTKLHVQLLLAIAAGIIAGALFPKFAVQLKPLGNIFIYLIGFLLAPIVFATVTAGIARMSDLKSVGRVGLKALIYFQIVSVIALLMGLAVALIARPGAVMNVEEMNYHPAAAHPSLLLRILKPNILLVILVAIILGILLARFQSRARWLIALLDALLHLLFRLVRIVMYIAPLAAFGSMAWVIGTYGIRQLVPYAELLACLYLTCCLFLICILAPIARWSGIPLLKFLRYILDEILIVFGTCSTEAVMPQMMLKLEKLGCPPALVGMVLPAGYTFNADGTSIYLTLAAVFIAQATKTPLSPHDILTLLLVFILTSKGSAGVAGAGLVTLAATLESTGKIPVAGISLVLGIESLLNQARAVTNVIGNGVATLAIAKSESPAAQISINTR